MKAFDRLSSALAMVLSSLAMVGTAVIAVVMALNVIYRLSAGGGLQGATEFSTVLIAGIAYLGIADAQRNQGHVATRLVADRLPRTVQLVGQYSWMLVTLGVLGWLARANWQRALDAYRMAESHFAADIPLWPSRFAIAVAFSALTLELARQLLLSLRSREILRAADEPQL